MDEYGNTRELIVETSIENVNVVTEFVEKELNKFNCSNKTISQIDIAIDEIFSNISFYAYQDNYGLVTIQVEMSYEPLCVSITFIDSGVPYNPLEKENPDTTLSLEDRKIGGLGIYIVRKSMDDMSYEYCEGKNILTIKKYL